jgi:hypothetical protein
LVLTLAAWTSATADPPLSGDDAQCADGDWKGSYTSEAGESAALEYVLAKDDKGRCRGQMKYTNQDGEHVGDFTLIELADTKFKGKAAMHGGAFEVAVEGDLKGNQLAGSYSVSVKQSGEIVDRGTWKLTRSATEKGN